MLIGGEVHECSEIDWKSVEVLTQMVNEVGFVADSLVVSWLACHHWISVQSPVLGGCSQHLLIDAFNGCCKKAMCSGWCYSHLFFWVVAWFMAPLDDGIHTFATEKRCSRRTMTLTLPVADGMKIPLLLALLDLPPLLKMVTFMLFLKSTGIFPCGWRDRVTQHRNKPFRSILHGNLFTILS